MDELACAHVYADVSGLALVCGLEKYQVPRGEPFFADLLTDIRKEPCASGERYAE